MDPKEIRVGETYLCKEKYYRRVRKIERRYGVDMVSYDSGRSPSNMLPQTMASSLIWFAGAALSSYSHKD